MDKLIVKPLEVRGWGNVTMERELTDFSTVRCFLVAGSSVINGLELPVYSMDFMDLTLSADTISVFDEVTVTITAPNVSDGETVTLLVNDSEETLTVSSGVAVYTYSPQVGGDVEFKAVYNGFESNTYVLHVNKLTPYWNLKIVDYRRYDGYIEILGDLRYDNKTIKGVTVNAECNIAELEPLVTLNGVYWKLYPPYASNTITVTLTNVENDVYKSVSATDTLTIT